LGDLRPAAVIGDKAYDADALLARIKDIGARAVIPPKSNRLHQRRYSNKSYRRRNRIERWFCRLKHFSSTSAVLPPATTNWPSASTLSSA
ncbi:MAG: transposase, partial [Burkholderiales bacterium]|nr:transposase [Burkholderiales bacterium]